MNMQTTDQLLMIRPSCFYTNEQTARNNYFQKQTDESQRSTTAKAQQEFDDFVDELRSHGVKVYVWQDPEEPQTPDALFPNNWVSFHNPLTLVTYPMYGQPSNGSKQCTNQILGVKGTFFYKKARFHFTYFIKCIFRRNRKYGIGSRKQDCLLRTF